jgi:hypothetical protein
MNGKNKFSLSVLVGCITIETMQILIGDPISKPELLNLLPIETFFQERKFSSGMGIWGIGTTVEPIRK